MTTPTNGVTTRGGARSSRCAAAWTWLAVAWGTSCGPAPEDGAPAAAQGETRTASAPLAQPSEHVPSPAPVPQAPGTEKKPPIVDAAPPAAERKAPQIPLGELLGRRDLWPKKVALVKPMTIAPGVTLPAGHELALHDFNGSDIVLDDGEDVFECPADQTDVLERASVYKERLTAEQLALDDNVLDQRPELWPVQAAVTRRMQFQNGKGLPIGREVTVRSIANGWANLYDAELADHFQAELFETDVLQRARERLLLPEADRRPFFVRAVAAALEPGAAASDPELAKTDLVLVYRARRNCPRCAAFAPELAEFYRRIKPAHANFEAVFYSDDRSAEDARAVFTEKELPGRALRFDRRIAAAELANQPGTLLPLVYLYDASGQLLANNHPDGGSPSAADVLAVAEAKLDEAR